MNLLELNGIGSDCDLCAEGDRLSSWIAIDVNFGKLGMLTDSHVDCRNNWDIDA